MSVVGEIAEAADLLVIGGGPGGYVAAIHAAQLGREVTLVERDGTAGLGGACLHVGCIPSKALIELADAAHRGPILAPAGLEGGPRGVSLPRFQSWRQELCAGLARGVQRRLERLGVTVVHGQARFNRPDRVAVHTAQDTVRFLEFRHAIVAVGSRAAALPSVPFDGLRVLDSTGVLALQEVPASLAVVGAGYIGLELGTAMAKLGARVTIVEAAERVLPSLEPALGASTVRRLRELGVEVRTHATVVGLDGDALVVQEPDARRRVAAERVLVAVGRRANTDALGLAAAGVAVASDGLIPVTGDRRAGERIAAIGDVVAGPAVAHKASAEAAVAAEALCGRPAAFDPTAIPLVVFADPELASVGLGERAAREAGYDVRVATFPLAASGRAATLRAPEGFVQLVADAATDRVLGAHLAGPHASELAAGATLAVELMAAPADLAGTIHPHPTISEGVHEAAEQLLGRPIHVSGSLALTEE